MLKVKNVSKKYQNGNVVALDNVSYTFPSTGLFYVVGPSGSGKSTLLKLVSGVEKDFEGDIIFNGTSIKDFSESELNEYLKYRVSIAFQSHELEKEFSIIENVDDIISLVDSNKKNRKERINELLKELDLFKIRKKKISRLSGGEKARVSLARALGKDVDMYLLDEPLNGLNKGLRVKVTEMLINLSKYHLVLVITHQRDEISLSSSSVLSIIDGKIKEEERINNTGKHKPVEIKRTRFSLTKLIRRTIKKVFYNKFRAFCTSLTIMVSLLSFGLATLISSGVVKEIENALTSNIVDNAIALEKKDYDFISDEKTNIDDINFEKIRLVMNTYIQSYGCYYIGDINNMFPNEHRLLLNINSKNIIVPTLTVQTLFDVKSPYEEQVQSKYKDLNYDELILGVSEAQFNIFFPGASLDDDVCLNNEVTLNLKIENQSWGYDADVLFVIKQVVITDKLALIHTHPGFLSHLVEEELELEASDNLESSDTLPWTMKRQSYVVINSKRVNNFIKDFYSDSRFNECDLISFKEEFPYRFGIIQRVSERLDIGEIKKMSEAYEGVYSYSYSTPFYQFGDEGLYAGFDNPFYLSSERSKINTLIDEYYKTSAPVLTSFNIVAPSNVIGGDLLGSMNNDSFVFETLKEGEEEELGDKIIISSGLAKYLDLDLGLSNKIHYAYLSKTEQEDESYVHTFITGYFEVSKVIEEKKCKIYQGPFFLIQLGLSNLNNDNAGNYYKALLRFDKSGEELISIKESLQQNYPDYYFSIPGERVKTSIEPTIALIRDILYALSFFSFLIATFLLTYTLLLIVIEDKRSIITKYNLGYRKKDLIIEYGFISIFYSSFPGVSSAFLIYFVQIAFSSSLSSIMNTSSMSLTIVPSILVLILSLAIGLIANVFIALHIYNLFTDKKIFKDKFDKLKNIKTNLFRSKK